jgi:hypothetical protein
MVYANSVPWLREIQQNTIQPKSAFLQTGKGEWDLPPESRLQLPAIAVEIVQGRSLKGYQIGGGLLVYTDVIFHCVAEDEVTRNKLVDIVSFQNDKNIRLFDSNLINNASKFPLNHNGVPVSGALRYPDLVDQYEGGMLRLTKANAQEMIFLGGNLYGGIVRFTTEGIKTNI